MSLSEQEQLTIPIDIILQGPIHNETFDAVQEYLAYPAINKVIVSTWQGESKLTPLDNLEVIYTPDVSNPGQNNRNRQIVSTQEGLKVSTAPVVIKSRTDQRIFSSSLDIMQIYFYTNYAIEEKFLDGSGPKGAIFAIGLYEKFVFHPQDHLFMGWREDIEALFDLPLDPKWPKNLDNPGDNVGIYSDWAHTDTRPNAYLGMHYYARFDERIAHMVEHYQDYVVDAAKYRKEALEYDKKYRDKIFKAFPKLKVYWEKYRVMYPYHWGIPFTEYHA
jgi:hypothetical protein